MLLLMMSLSLSLSLSLSSRCSTVALLYFVSHLGVMLLDATPGATLPVLDTAPQTSSGDADSGQPSTSVPSSVARSHGGDVSYRSDFNTTPDPGETAPGITPLPRVDEDVEDSGKHARASTTESYKSDFADSVDEKEVAAVAAKEAEPAPVPPVVSTAGAFPQSNGPTEIMDG